MLNCGTFPHFLRNGLWAEAANTAKLVKNNLNTKSRDLSPFKHVFGKEKRSMSNTLYKFGEMCIITHSDNLQYAKLTIWTSIRIWACFADEHLAGT